MSCIANLSPEEILEKRARNLQNQRERQKRYYEKNKTKILQKKKECYINFNNKVKELNQQPDPIEEISFPVNDAVVINEPDATITTTKQTRNKKPIYNIETIRQLLEGLDIRPASKTKYVNDISTFFKLTGCSDLVKCLRHYKKIFEFLDTSINNRGTPYSINSKKGFLQSVLFIIDKFDLNINKKIKDVLKNQYDIWDLESRNQTEENKNKAIMKWGDYIELVKEKYGTTGKQYLLTMLYREVPVRDDFHLKIIDKVLDDNSENYLFVNKNDMGVIINNYKTSGKYGTLKFKLSKPLQKLIRNYLKKYGIEVGEYLFGVSKLLTPYVSTMNKNMGLTGSINLFREMTISENKNRTPEEILQLAKKMGHNFKSTNNYIREIFENN